MNTFIKENNENKFTIFYLIDILKEKALNKIKFIIYTFMIKIQKLLKN